MRLFRKFMNWMFLLFGVACILYYLACGISVRFNQSMLWIWPLLGTAFILRFIIVQISIVRGVPLPYPDWFLWMFRGACIAAAALFIFVESFIFSGLFMECPPGVDYIIVLGAKTGSKVLDRRIAAAAQYMHENPETIAIASGGQGKDEETSEGFYIMEGLLRLGVPRERILVEDQSTSTSENIRFSSALVSNTSATIGVVTNNFHAFRAKHLAKAVFQGEIFMLPVHTSRLSLPHYMVREFFTTVVDTLKGNTSFQ